MSKKELAGHKAPGVANELSKGKVMTLWGGHFHFWATDVSWFNDFG